MKLIRIIITVILLFIHLVLFSNSLDSLFMVLKKTPLSNKPLVLMTIADVYVSLNQYEQAALFYNKSYETALKIKDQLLMANILEKQGVLNVLTNNPQTAIKYFSDARYIFGKKKFYARANNQNIYLAKIYFSQKQYDLALQHLNKAVLYFQTHNNVAALVDIYYLMFNAYDSLNNKQNALKYLNYYLIYKDSLIAQQIQKQKENFNKIYQTTTKQKQVIELTKQEEKKIKNISYQQLIKNISKTLIVFVVIFILLLLARYNENKKTSKIIKNQRDQILESINYASKIQRSILFKEEEIKVFIPNLFIYFKPRDIVSGDFYWFSAVNNKLIYAIADCTGHGVPGAFMTMIGNILLNDIINVKHILEPSEILINLHLGVVNALNQNQNNAHADSGMEIALCVIDKNNTTITFASAGLFLFYFYENKLNVIQGGYFPIGGSALHDFNTQQNVFISHTIIYKSPIHVFFTTDGYIDQFGGLENKKFGIKNFKLLLNDIVALSPEEQKQIVDNQFNEWSMNNKQIDDVLVSGFSI